jgi:hypothetical protein
MSDANVIELSQFERAVLDKLLSGDNEVLARLRRQVIQSKLKKREYSGVGFFCEFEIEPNAPSVDLDVEIGDVQAAIPGLAHGAGFVLFIRDGRITTLEGYTYDELWPDSIGKFVLSYTDPDRKTELAKLE